MDRRWGILFTITAPLLLGRCTPAGRRRSTEGATGSAAPAAVSSHRSIEGMYRLAFRQMQDGTRLEPPTVDGLMDFADGYRNVSLIEHRADGGIVTLSSMSTYTLTDSLYTEHQRYSMITGYSRKEGGGFLENREASAPVTLGADGSISFTLPLVGVHATFNADSLTITMGTSFAGHWVRLKSPKHPGPSIEGTYRLAYRQMTDGTRIEPPTVDGLMNFAAGYRNFSIIEHNARAGIITVSSMGSYALDDSLYTEHRRYRMDADSAENGQRGLTENRDGSAAVTRAGDGSISLTLSLDGARATFTADSFTAVLGKSFVDHWARVKPARGDSTRD